MEGVVKRKRKHMTVAVTDAITARYWQWVIGLTQADFDAGHVITTDPGGSGVAFLMDPRDGPNGGTFPQRTNNMLGPHQSILTPLWIGLGDDKDGPNNNQLPITAEENYLLGNIQSHVKINGVDVLSNPFLNVDVCLKAGPTVTYMYHPPSQGPGTTLYQAITNFPADSFSFTMPANSYKLLHALPGDHWTAGFHPYAASVGLWAVISPSDGGLPSWSNGNTISYSTTVGSNSLGLNCLGTVHTYSTTITYTVT